jgi:SAM-dependent methyltransferase
MRADLRAYYEEEARLRLRSPVVGRRSELRDAFIALLREEGRTSVVDFGAGPGGDGGAFRATGLRFIGVDLAHGNCQLAAEAGVMVVQGSISAPPVRPASLDAGWSMSTLMHIPEPDVPDTLTAMIATLRPGAPLLVGLWGGEQRDLVDESKIQGQRRLYRLRSFERNREMLTTCGTVELASCWDFSSDGWQYQVFQIRT